MVTICLLAYQMSFLLSHPLVLFMPTSIQKLVRKGWGEDVGVYVAAGGGGMGRVV